MEAVKASISLSAEPGAHKNEEGLWDPCKSKEDYTKALEKQEDCDSYIEKNKFVKREKVLNVCKVDTSKRMVFGWAQICTKNGEDYYDSDNQCFDEEVTLGTIAKSEDEESTGWLGFMLKSRTHKAMHDGEPVGDVAFAFPAFDDIMKSLGFETIEKTGIITGVYVSDDAVLEKFHKGEYTGFSIGGSAIFEDEE